MPPRSRVTGRYIVGEVMTKEEAEAAGAIFQGSKAGTGTQYKQCWCNRCFERFYVPVGETVSISAQFERKLPLCAFAGQAICQRGAVEGQPHPAPNPNVSGIQLLARRLEEQEGWDETRLIMKQHGMPLAQVYAAVTTAVAQDPTHRNKTTKNPAALEFVRVSARAAVDNFQPPQVTAPPAPHTAIPAPADPPPAPVAGGAAVGEAPPPLPATPLLAPAAGPPSAVEPTTAVESVEAAVASAAQQPVDDGIERCIICHGDASNDAFGFVGFPCPGITAEGQLHRFHQKCMASWLNPEHRQPASGPRASSDIMQAAILNAASGRGCPTCKAPITSLVPLGGPPGFAPLRQAVEIPAPPQASRTSPRTAGQLTDAAVLNALRTLQSNGVWSAMSGLNAMSIGERRPGGRTSFESRLEAAASTGAGSSSDAQPTTAHAPASEHECRMRANSNRDYAGGERPQADPSSGIGRFFNPSRSPSPCPSYSSTPTDIECDAPPSAAPTVLLTGGEPESESALEGTHLSHPPWLVVRREVVYMGVHPPALMTLVSVSGSAGLDTPCTIERRTRSGAVETLETTVGELREPPCFLPFQGRDGVVVELLSDESGMPECQHVWIKSVSIERHHRTPKDYIYGYETCAERRIGQTTGARLRQPPSCFLHQAYYDVQRQQASDGSQLRRDGDDGDGRYSIEAPPPPPAAPLPPPPASEAAPLRPLHAMVSEPSHGAESLPEDGGQVVAAGADGEGADVVAAAEEMQCFQSDSPVHLGSSAAFNGADTGPVTGRMRDDQAADSPNHLNAALGEAANETTATGSSVALSAIAAHLAQVEEREHRIHEHRLAFQALLQSFSQTQHEQLESIASQLREIHTSAPPEEHYDPHYDLQKEVAADVAAFLRYEAKHHHRTTKCLLLRKRLLRTHETHEATDTPLQRLQLALEALEGMKDDSPGCDLCDKDGLVYVMRRFRDGACCDLGCAWCAEATRYFDALDMEDPEDEAVRLNPWRFDEAEQVFYTDPDVESVDDATLGARKTALLRLSCEFVIRDVDQSEMSTDQRVCACFFAAYMPSIGEDIASVAARVLEVDAALAPLLEEAGAACSAADAAIEAACDPAASIDVLMTGVSCDGALLRRMSPAAQADPRVVRIAVAGCGASLEFASLALRDDESTVLLAVKRDGMALMHALERPRAEPRVVLAAVTSNGESLRFAHPDLRASRDVVLAAVGSDGFAIQWARADLQLDEEIVGAARRQNPDVKGILDPTLLLPNFRNLNLGPTVPPLLDADLAQAASERLRALQRDHNVQAANETTARAGAGDTADAMAATGSSEPVLEDAMDMDMDGAGTGGDGMDVDMDGAQLSPYETSGIHLIKNAIPVEASTVAAIQQSNFDERGIVGDRSRQLSKSSQNQWCKRLMEQQAAVLREHGHLRTSAKYGGKEKEVLKMRGLLSLETEGYDEAAVERQEGDQGEHTDESVEVLQGMADVDKPSLTMYAIQDGTRLRIKPLDGDWMTIWLKPGDLLVFRGDVCHCGMGYAKKNYRVHAYVYPPGYKPGPSSLHQCS